MGRRNGINAMNTYLRLTLWMCGVAAGILAARYGVGIPFGR
jgi:hypothetical protein